MAEPPPSEAVEPDLALVREALEGEFPAVDRLLARLRCVPRTLAVLNRRAGWPLSEDQLEGLAVPTTLRVWKRLGAWKSGDGIEICAFRVAARALVERLVELAERDGLPGGVAREPEADGARPRLAEWIEAELGSEAGSGASDLAARVPSVRDSAALLDVLHRIGTGPEVVASVLDAAARERHAPGEELLGGLRHRLGAQRDVSPWPFVRFLAALAVLLVILVPLWLRALGERQAAAADDGWLRSRSPAGEVFAWEAFDWTGDWPPESSFEVRVFDGKDHLRANSERLFEPRWNLEGIDTSAWPDRIRWELTLFDPSGEPSSTSSTVAWRR